MHYEERPPNLTYPLISMIILLILSFGIIVAEGPIKQFTKINFNSWNAVWCLKIAILQY